MTPFLTIALCLLWCLVIELPGVTIVHARRNNNPPPTAAPTQQVVTSVDEKGIQLIGESWVVSHVKGVMKGQSLTIQRIHHPVNRLHSCYRVICNGKHCHGENDTATMDMCYPAVIVTGLPKCGTSAMYDLLSRFPGAMIMHEKENCPYTRRRAHWLFFQSFPAFDSIKENNLIIDGCIDVINNMKMREMLHEPNTYYIVMIRDFADMIWSSYNFWCKVGYDKEACGYERWANKDYHIRSPEIFHDLIVADSQGNTTVVQPFYYPMHRPCANAGGYYNEYIDFHVRRYTTEEYVIIIASEDLEINPKRVANLVANRIHYPIHQLGGLRDLHNFTKIRINSQENKGTTHSILLDSYKPGVYNISNYRPMLDDTRILLNQCWYDDCRKIAQRTNYTYAACFNSTNSRHSSSGNSGSMSVSTTTTTSTTAAAGTTGTTATSSHEKHSSKLYYSGEEHKDNKNGHIKEREMLQSLTVAHAKERLITGDSNIDNGEMYLKLSANAV